MRQKAPILLLVSILAGSMGSACTPRPSRPSDYTGTHKQGYEACERAYSACIAGGRADDGSAAVAPPDRIDEREGGWDAAYGWTPDCNRTLKRCYERESARHVPSPDAGQPSPQ